MDSDCALFIVVIPNDQHSTQHAVKRKEGSSSFCINLKKYLAEKMHEEPVWILSSDSKSYQVTFHAELGSTTDRILHDLKNLGIGKNNGSQISVVPSTVIFGLRSQPSNTSSKHSSSVPRSNQTQLDVSRLENPEGSKLRRIYRTFNVSHFKKSIRARLTVHQVVASVRASSELSFDFVALVSLASMLAAVGLLENSSVVIVASMLVSPLMNPIMGIVFGLSVREHSLWRRGFISELIGLLLCILWGFIIGLCTTHAGVSWGSSNSFPTTEMRNRGDIKRLWVGVLIALPSGAGVALSLLGGNTGSLVGVAISASLLPPAVNCGVLLAYAALARRVFGDFWGYVHVEQEERTNVDYFTFVHRFYPSPTPINCTRPINNGYFPFYSCDMALEGIILGIGSLLLTLVNIACIIVTAFIILRVKEVIPMRQRNESIDKFFHHDVKIAREYNRTAHHNTVGPVVEYDDQLQNINIPEKSIIDHQKNKNEVTNVENELSISVINTKATLDNTRLMNLKELQTYAEDFDLNVLDEKDRELLTPESIEKVSYLVKNLLDVYEEDSSESANFTHYVPNGDQISVQHERRIFYEHIIKLLPFKWQQIFEHEQRQRQKTSVFKSSLQSTVQTN